MVNIRTTELEGDLAQLTYELGLKDKEVMTLKQSLERLNAEVEKLRNENRGLKSELEHWNKLPMSPISLSSENDQTEDDKNRMIQENLRREILSLKNESNILSEWIKTLIS
ncbi:uncharacterized protein KLLA0_D03740g [Kluyveromyces lactis]|uniref:KLLA0D03740p n=1 Tax=Kluyveromyces lactis (strain ATCC 8585 / CBS 2359 / DSM 70799 / NBRC 1267 / NRRL Y-1140 / WM37) TaxID=284590 RepID=Q6CS58_KLULA|nr:uncharacterized protein KLLA0_D03740g [Kluyveromyces lactis]CAH00327.1 KLLA0D03740p [Kluyveromyces lactis]|eukprot:XP_453231.1 uncharacterized protein KLLA0_D03740g [Kluyveromyces lactis]